jgi:hypothetical protein
MNKPQWYHSTSVNGIAQLFISLIHEKRSQSPLYILYISFLLMSCDTPSHVLFTETLTREGHTPHWGIKSIDKALERELPAIFD